MLDINKPRESERVLFNELSKRVEANYRADPADKKARGGYLLRAISLAQKEHENFSGFESHNNVSFGLQVSPPSGLQRLFGIKARVKVLADSTNLLSMFTDFSNTESYSLRSLDPERLSSFVEKMANNLERQYRIRVFLGI